MKIKISAVNDLATEIVFPDYDSYDNRRDLILIWLKRHGVSVWGRRRRSYRDNYDRLKKKMHKRWGRNERL